jgi:hypothetical protein
MEGGELMRSRALIVASLLALLSLQGVVPGFSAGLTTAVPKRLAQHERAILGTGSPSPLVADNFDVLGHVNLPGGAPNGDVFFYDHGGSIGKFAYVGTWSDPCSGTGVKVIDVNDPSHPKFVTTAGAMRGVSHEDIVVRRIGDRDVLAVGVQICKAGAVGGLQLIDVTNPRQPKVLSFLRVPSGGIHELDMVVRPDGQVLVLAAVPFAEFDNVYFGTDNGGDFRIIDVTDPLHSVELSTWGIIADSSLPIVAGNDEISSPFQGIGYFAAYLDHSARAADDGMTAYLSYWDGGILKLDISDPTAPQLVGRTTYPFDADGDGHSLTLYEAGGQRYVLQNDEDFDSLSPTVITSTATGSEEFAGIEEPWAPTLLTDLGPVSGSVHDAGDGCQADDYTGAAGKLALADTVDPFYVGIIQDWTAPCSIGTQVVLAAQAGAAGFVSNLVSPDDAYPFFDGDARAVNNSAGSMAIVQISDIDEIASAIRTALGAGDVTMTLTPGEPSWGFLRVFSESTADDVDGDGVLEFHQVGSFSDLPHVTGELRTPPGAWSIHNTEVNGDRAYSSWYTNGIVALDLTDPTSPALVGQFVPSTKSLRAGGLGTGPALVWGVAIDPETGTVYASEMRSGLWIVQPTGPAAPSD